MRWQRICQRHLCAVLQISASCAPGCLGWAGRKVAPGRELGSWGKGEGRQGQRDPDPLTPASMPAEPRRLSHHTGSQPLTQFTAVASPAGDNFAVWRHLSQLRGLQLVLHGQKPGVLVNSLQYTGQPPHLSIIQPKISAGPQSPNLLERQRLHPSVKALPHHWLSVTWATSEMPQQRTIQSKMSTG